MWTLCVQLQATEVGVATSKKKSASTSAAVLPAPPKRAVLSVAEDTTTVEALHTLAAQALGLVSAEPSVASTTTSSSTTATSLIELVVGYPRNPQTLSNLHQTIVETGLIQNQDKILVIPKSINDTPATGMKGTKSKTKASAKSLKSKNELSINDASPPPQQKGRPRRQAAAKAVESIAVAIEQEQNAAAATAAAQAKSASSPSRKTSVSSSVAATQKAAKAKVIRHFAALERAACQTQKASAAAPSNDASKVIGGRRLRDGAAIASSSPTQSRQAKRRKNGTTAVPESSSLAEGLVALTSTASSTGRLMRQGWRQAVQSAHEQNRAACRVAAVADSGTGGTSMESVQYELLPATSNSGGNNAQDNAAIQPLAQLKVTYAKGVQGRGHFVDTVDFVERDVLSALIADIYPAEALRSSNLALLSPRVFWSLLHHYQQHQVEAATATTNPTTTTHRVSRDVVHQALQWLKPDLDWSYLRRRPVQLSAKARENLRQQAARQGTAGNADIGNDDWEAAANAIAEVEQAMTDMPSFLAGNDSAGAAAAAGANQSDVSSAEDWSIETPTEEDRDEIKEGIRSYQDEQMEETMDHGSSNNICRYELEDVVDVLCQQLELCNWRQLANVESAQTLSEQLVEALQSKTRNAATAGSDSSSADLVPVSEEAIEGWVEYAQQQSMEEIIVEICDGNADAVDLLHESAKSGTPKDLALWQPIVVMLYQRLVEFAPDNDNMALPSLPTLTIWCNRAQKALVQFEWLRSYATPVG